MKKTLLCVAAALAAALPVSALAQTDRAISLGSKLAATAPEGWIRKAPRAKIIEHEFAIPAAKGDKADGRMTVMTSGGSLEANLERWYGQFSQPDGSKFRDKAKVEKKMIAGREVHVVDISGTYRDAPGPFAKPIDRPGYRMLAAVVATDEGNYFLKFYGPAKTVEGQAGAFRAMLEGMK